MDCFVPLCDLVVPLSAQFCVDLLCPIELFLQLIFALLDAGHTPLRSRTVQLLLVVSDPHALCFAVDIFDTGEIPLASVNLTVQHKKSLLAS